MRGLAFALIFAGFSGVAAAQQVQPTPAALERAYACAAIVEDGARLACYDEAVGRLREAEASGQVVALDRGRVETLRRESFGFQLPNLANLLPEGEGGMERLEMTVERVTRNAVGRHTFVMTNGQSWSQVDPQSASNVRPGDTITIRQAALGSFMLSPQRGAAHRVRREN